MIFTVVSNEMGWLDGKEMLIVKITDTRAEVSD